MIQAGDRAPDFTATDMNGAEARLSAHRGRYVVLYFFPKAFTSG